MLSPTTSVMPAPGAYVGSLLDVTVRGAVLVVGTVGVSAQPAAKLTAAMSSVNAIRSAGAIERMSSLPAGSVGGPTAWLVTSGSLEALRPRLSAGLPLSASP